MVCCMPGLPSVCISVCFAMDGGDVLARALL